MKKIISITIALLVLSILFIYSIEKASFTIVADPGGPYTGNPGTSVTFDGSKSHTQTGHSIVGYWWKFEDTDTFHEMTSYANHTYESIGEYTVSLKVVDDTGINNTASTTATINSSPPPSHNNPVAHLNLPWYDAFEGDSIIFVASGTAYTGYTIARLRLEVLSGEYDHVYDSQIDASITNPFTVTEVFLKPRTQPYHVTLTVWDNSGLSNTITEAIVISYHVTTIGNTVDIAGTAALVAPDHVPYPQNSFMGQRFIQSFTMPTGTNRIHKISLFIHNQQPFNAVPPYIQYILSTDPTSEREFGKTQGTITSGYYNIYAHDSQNMETWYDLLSWKNLDTIPLNAGQTYYLILKLGSGFGSPGFGSVNFGLSYYNAYSGGYFSYDNTTIPYSDTGRDLAFRLDVGYCQYCD